MKIGLDDFFVANPTHEQEAYEGLERIALDDVRLLRLAAWYQSWRQRQKGTDVDSDDRVELDADVGDLQAITTQALDVLVSRNDPPRLFVYGGLPVRLEIDEDGRPKPTELTTDRLRHELANAAQWTTAKHSFFGRSIGRDAARPPVDVAKNILATPHLPFPSLKGIVETPVATRDGRILQQPGFDRDTGIFYEPFDADCPIDIPTTPTQEDLAQAKALLDEILTDFAFVADADRAHAVALAIALFVRHLIDGPVPLHNVEAPGPGVGKNLLAEMLLYVAVGDNVGRVTDSRDDEEWRKRITARVREARPVVLLDNLIKPLVSGVVSSALTAWKWDDRLLGTNENISLPMRIVWAMTANNPILSLEIARRSIRIRLDARTDRPWLREGFRHPDLRQWVKDHRGELIQAILIMVRAWLNAGRPAPTARPLGSFEVWTTVVGGIVEFAGYPGFLGNALEFYEVADGEGRTWRIFVEQWWAAHAETSVSVADLFALAEGIEAFYLGKATNERGQKTSLGRQLKQRRDQVIVGYRIEEAGSCNNAAQWRLRQIGVSAAVPPAPPSPSTADEVDLYVD